MSKTRRPIELSKRIHLSQAHPFGPIKMNDGSYRFGRFSPKEMYVTPVGHATFVGYGLTLYEEPNEFGSTIASETTAIVELNDGRVKLVDVELIRFLDID